MEDKSIVNSFLVADLIAGHLQSTLNEKEQEALTKWINESEQNHRIFNELISEHQITASLKELASYHPEEALLKFKSKNVKTRSRLRILPNWFKIAAAASIICVCALGLRFYLHKSPVTVQLAAQGKIDVNPGSNRAVLTLANGKQIVLDNKPNGQIAKEADVVISKTKNGSVVYDLTNQNDAKDKIIAYNTISTPRGGQYQVILPDGSHVWLNAASSIRFPTVFRSGERKVDITGEAYFEVAKDKTKPFRVMAEGQMVEVLGTHFNIMAYADENAIVTTLLEGSVRVSSPKNQAVLKPNQDATLQRNTQSLAVKDVDAEAAVMWKNGYFLFNDESLASIMRKVSRWYNIEIVYKGAVAQKTFGGTISRFKNLSELLEVLEATGSVHFKIEEGRVIAMP